MAANKALTVWVFMTIAALAQASSGDGFIEPTEPTPRGCDAARAAFYALVGPPRTQESSEAVYDQLRDVYGRGACRLSKTCCSSVAEQNLSTAAAAELRERVVDMWDQRASSCNSSTFKEALAMFIEDSKVSLVQILEEAYFGFFTRPELFDEFYNYLQRAVWTADTCHFALEFNKLFFKVFLAVLEADPGVDTREYPQGDHDFNVCMYNYYAGITGEDTHSRFIALTRSFNRTMYYIRALNTAEALLKTVAKLQLTPQCRQALLRSSYCAECSGLTSQVRPCLGFCLNTIRGCLVDYADLYEPYRRFTEAAIAMKEYLNSKVNPFTHIDQLTTGFLDVTTNIQQNSRRYHEAILVKCRGNQAGKRKRQAAAPSEDHPLYPRSLFTRSTVAPPSEVFNNSAYCHLELADLFKTVPGSICQAMSESHDSSSCWNGASLNKYDKQVLNLTREEQQNNPEMVVCPVLPTEVKVQLAYLERVTVEMNIISRSEVCPEDDEDCQVDEQRCNYNILKPLASTSSTEPAPKPPTDDEDARGGVRGGSGSGCGSEDGSGFGSGSGDCTPTVVNEEVEECLVDPFVPTVAPSGTVQQPTATSLPSSSTSPSTSPSPSPTKEPPIVILLPASCPSLAPPTLLLLLSLLLASSVTVLQSVL